MPVLHGGLADAEAVAAGFHGQGYFYADLILDVPGVTADSLEVWLNLVDDDQLRVLNESEGVRQDGGYVVASLPAVGVSALGIEAEAAVYVTPHHTMHLGGQAHPVAFDAVTAVGRKLRSYDQLAMFELFIEEHELAAEISEIIGASGNGQLVDDLMAFANGQWWFTHHTGRPGLQSFAHLGRLLWTAIGASSHDYATVERLRDQGRVLSRGQAFVPDGRWKLGR